MRPLSRHLQTAVATTLLATQLLACTSWQVVDPAPLALADPRMAESVRLTLVDSTQVVWDNAVVVDGRIGTAPDAADGVRLTDVRQLQARRLSWFKTVLAAGLTAGAVGGLVALNDALNSGFGFSW